MKAIKPDAIPALPESAIEWRRSDRRGSVFHARDALGMAVCRTILLDRFKSKAAEGLGDMQYWGVCPRCYAAGQKRKGKAA